MPVLLVPRETAPEETRVAAVPETVARLAQLGLEVRVERGAGERAGLPDDAYEGAGARLVAAGETWGEADLVVKVAPPDPGEVARLRPEALLVALVQPATNLDVVRALRERGVTTLALDLLPRTTRAQAMDVLSSQATVAGYKAMLLAASHLPRLCPLLMTAAGTVRPARVVVFGAGVAGLMAIATARRLGCVVEATDVRMAAKEQVQSLGARFIEVPGLADLETKEGYAKEAGEEVLRRQREEVASRVAEADVVIATAQVPGKRAPVLVTAEMVRSMKPGSVVVDLAVDSGGNCELSRRGEVASVDGRTVVGLSNLPATVPFHASELFARNVANLVKLLVKDGRLEPDWSDEILAGCRLTHAGEVGHAPTAERIAGGAAR